MDTPVIDAAIFAAFSFFNTTEADYADTPSERH